MSAPRTLNFNDWDSIEADLRELTAGYDQLGKWDLSQAALHLNDWLTYPMDGFPKNPWPIGAMMGMVRATMGKSMLRRSLKEGFRPGTPTFPGSVHRADEAEDAAAVEQLLGTITRFRNYSEEICPSPLFGKMDYETAERLQFVHFAHHLRLLVPKSEAAPE